MSSLQTIFSFYLLLGFIKPEVKTNKNSLTQESEDRAGKLGVCNAVADFWGLTWLVQGEGRIGGGKGKLLLSLRGVIWGEIQEGLFIST